MDMHKGIVLNSSVLLGREFETMIRADKDIVAVFLFGSLVRGESSSLSDVDVCLVLRPGKYEDPFLSGKKVSYMKHVPNEKIGIHIFQQLPIYVRVRVLREGRTLLTRNEDALYDMAMDTVREFESFKRHYDDYLKGMLDDRQR